MMFSGQQFQSSRQISPLGCALTVILVGAGIYFIFKGLYYLLYKVAPFLVLAALLINWRAVVKVGEGLFSLLTRKPILGILLGMLMVVAFPITALFLLLTALGANKLEKMQDEMAKMQETLTKQMSGNPDADGEYVDYEEVDDPPPPPPSTLNIPEQLPRNKEKSSSE